MINRITSIALFISLLSTFSVNVNVSKVSCNNNPKECQLVDITQRQIPTNSIALKCLLNDATLLRFNKSNDKTENCEESESKPSTVIIRPKDERSFMLKKGTLDLNDLITYLKGFESLELVFEYLSGFEINLFDGIIKNYKTLMQRKIEIKCVYSKFEFYLGDKLLKSCQDFNSTSNIKSIFQLFTNINKDKLELYLAESTNKICPLALSNFEVDTLRITGYNSFYLRKLLKFSHERFEDLNSRITSIEIILNNIDLDFEFLHPSVFKHLENICIWTTVNKIHEDLFHELDNVTEIHLMLENTRNLMHNNGIEWIKNMNKAVNCNLSNRSQVIEYVNSKKVKFISHDVENRPVSPPLLDVFPDEDFCLYKDFPINQLVVVYQAVEDDMDLQQPRIDLGCTYLWLTLSYEALVDAFVNDSNPNLHKIMRSLLESDDYKSISKCTFDEKLKRCNRTDFKRRQITTFYDIGEAMYISEIVLNILSLILSILGLVSNILIIITISSKMNEADFKEFKQYDYLRLNSICNCLILVVHLSSWLNQCIYPFQVFCPLIRKTYFMQYFKIIFQDVLMTVLRFMNSFTYIGFAFNRISLIGKDHNELVKFMCRISIKKFIGVSLFISVGLSVIKFFEYDINKGIAVDLYPVSYEYSILNSDANLNITLFVINFISDMLNHFVLLLFNLAIDIGMIVKLKQTLNERLENVKAYSTIAQQEKKKTDNENVLDNAISMVILNTSLNLLFKLPASFFSLIYLWYSIYLQHNVPYVWENRTLERFFKRVCIDANFCDTLNKLSDFLYLLSISLQFFFYKHYDKKLNSAIKKKFGPKKNIQTGLYSLFSLVNMVTSPEIADEKLEMKRKFSKILINKF